MLQIKNLNITLKKDVRTLFNDFNFILNDGDKAVIIGEEGDGKSTLLKLIYDPNLVDSYIEYSGEIIKDGMRLGYLCQEMDSEQKSMTVYDYFSSLDFFFDVSPKDMSEISRKLSIDSDIFYSDRLIGTMSGGERVKLQLARILIEAPDMLLLDVNWGNLFSCVSSV